MSRVRLRVRLMVLESGPSVRRLSDIVGAALGLLVLSPIFLFAAVAIKVSSRGPVFFRQVRIGAHGLRFNMPKFRTMVVNAEAMKAKLAQTESTAMDGVRFKLERDPRVTRVGRFLRRFSIDELPQLWSVLKGDMTIIGPRPPIVSEVMCYDALAARRLEVKPGLTCLWQVGGRSDLSFEEQVRLDIEYIDRTRGLDEVKIFAATIPAVLKGSGAY